MLEVEQHPEPEGITVQTHNNSTRNIRTELTELLSKLLPFPKILSGLRCVLTEDFLKFQVQNERRISRKVTN